MQQIPDEVQGLIIDGVLYYIRWEALTVGASFFIPTLATAATVAKALRHPAGFLGFDLKVATRCERGRYGARIWRVG